MTIAVDFDGTIVEHRYPAIGKERPFAVATLRQLQRDMPDLHLILWTVREGELLEQAVAWCAERGLEFYAVNSNYPEELPSPSAGNQGCRKVTATSADCRNGRKSTARLQEQRLPLLANPQHHRFSAAFSAGTEISESLKRIIWPNNGKATWSYYVS